MNARRRWTELALFLLFVGGFLLFARSQLFFDPGSFWHTVIGEKLLTDQPFLDTDPLTFSQAGRPWIPSQWLAEIGMALLHRALGLDGLFWGTVLVLSGLFAWLGGRLIAGGCHPLLAGLLVALCLMGMCYHFHARPHVLTMLFLGLVVATLVEVDAGRWPVVALAALVPLFLLWVNCHGGVVGGLASFGLVAFGWGGAFLLGRGPLRSWSDFAVLALVGMGCVATIFMNPYGWRLPQTWLQILTLDLPNVIAEHKPLDLTAPEGLAVALLGGLYLFMLIGTGPAWPRVTWLLPLIWLVQAWLRVRNGPLFAVTATVVLADLLPHSRWMLALSRRSDLFVPPKSPPTSVGAMARLHLPWWLLLVPVPLLLPADWSRGWVKLDPEHWPITILDQIRQEISRPDARVFCDDACGGFLTYHVPGVPIFFDDRCELHGLYPPERPLLFDYVDGLKNDETAAATFARWDRQFHFNVALIHSANAYAQVLRRHPEWTLVAETAAAEAKKRISLFRRGGAQ